MRDGGGDQMPEHRRRAHPPRSPSAGQSRGHVEIGEGLPGKLELEQMLKGTEESGQRGREPLEYEGLAGAVDGSLGVE